MRFSVAIELKEELKEKVLEAQAPLKSEFSKLTWLEDNQLYLTLKFLGNPHLSRMGRIKKTLKKVSSGVAPFSISTTKLGCFPATGVERTIWCGVSDESRMLRRLVADVEEQFSKMGIKKTEQEFTPHIVIGRAPKNDLKGKVRKLTSKIELERSDQEVKDIVLLCSKVKKGVPTYEVFSRYSLSASVL